VIASDAAFTADASFAGVRLAAVASIAAAVTAPLVDTVTINVICMLRRAADAERETPVT